MSKTQAVKTAPWDAADFLDTPEAIAAYLDAAVEEARDDPGYLLTALDTVARAGNSANSHERSASAGRVCTRLSERTATRLSRRSGRY
ncbi:MAG: hypothetical protein WAV45_02120 [Propionibacteriaceae bacterium]